MLSTWLFAAAAVLLAALAVQLAALWGMGRRQPIGDEDSYLARGEAEDPYAPRLFLRVPLMPWLAARCHRAGGSRNAGERRLRLVMAVIAWLTVVATLIAGWRLGGPQVAILAALLLVVQPERILVGCHIWPDTLLGLVLAALAVASTLPGSPAAALAAGGLCALGVLGRIDFLVVPPLVLAAWGAAQGSLSADGDSWWIAAAIIAPTLLVLVLWSLRNHRRYGLPLPDTTWAFNLEVASSAVGRGGRVPHAIHTGILAALETWRSLTPAQAVRRGLAALGRLVRSPRVLGHGIAGRILTLAGPDTFIRRWLLADAYPDLGARARQRWVAGSRIAFPLLLTVVLVTAASGPRLPPAYAWPSLGLLLPAVLFHARTRYRVAVMPALSLVAAQGIVGHAGSLADRPLAASLFLGGGALLFWALLQIRSAEV